MATLPLSHVAQLEAYPIDDVGIGIEYNNNVVLYTVQLLQTYLMKGWNSDPAGIYANGLAVRQPIMLRPFRSICKQSPLGRTILSSSCEALHVICDSYIDESWC